MTDDTHRQNKDNKKSSENAALPPEILEEAKELEQKVGKLEQILETVASDRTK